MARSLRRKKRKGLGFISPDRFVVINLKPHGKAKACRKRVFTSYGDAAKVTMRCSRSAEAVAAKAPCFLLQGWAGAETIVGRCVSGKCGKPREGDHRLIEKCEPEYVTKARRRRLIAERATVPHHTTKSKASKSGIFSREKLPPELKGSRGAYRRRKTR